MIQMSQRWRDTILDSPERTMTGKIEISLGEAFADNKAIATSSPAQPNSKLAQLNDRVRDPDFAYASLDGAWRLGDGKRMSSEIYLQTGFRGWALSGAAGIFQMAQYVQLEFSTTKTVDQVEVSFDPKRNEYATDFSIEFYSSAQPGGFLGSWQITGNTQAICTVAASGADYPIYHSVNFLVLTVTKWCAANRTMKVTELFGAKVDVFSDIDRLISMDITEQADSTGGIDVGGVYASKLSCVLDNSDGYFSQTDPYDSPYIKNKRLDVAIGIVFDDGTSELCNAGAFYIDSLREDKNALTVTIEAQDIMKEFSNRRYVQTSNLTYPATLAQIFEDVILASGLPLRYVADSACSAYIIPTRPEWQDGADCRQVLIPIQNNNASIKRKDMVK